MEADEVLDPMIYKQSPDPSEASVNSAWTNMHGEVKPEGVLAQLQQLSKQQGQIAELLQRMLERDSAVANQKREPGTRGRTPVRCFYCKRLGHIKADCRKRLAEEQASKVDNVPPKPAVVGQTTHKPVNGKPPPL